MIYYINPVAKPRMTRSDKWKQRPSVLRYRDFCDNVRDLGLEIQESGCKLIFGIPMPKSWSNKRRAKMLYKPHQQKPDIDNLIKSVFDAVFSDDSHVWDISAKKVWSNVGFIDVFKLDRAL